MHNHTYLSCLWSSHSVKPCFCEIWLSSQQIGCLSGTLQRSHYTQEMESSFLSQLRITHNTNRVKRLHTKHSFPVYHQVWICLISPWEWNPGYKSILFPQALVRNINILCKSNRAKHFSSLLFWETTSTGLCQTIILCKHFLKPWFSNDSKYI